jgi:cation transport ATPase
MGIVTVMVLALILVWLDVVYGVFVDSFDVWFWIFLGFCEAGAILILIIHYENLLEERRQAHTRQAAINELEALRHGENIES